MATRKTSSSGAFMSQYDNEVETRLKALESAVKSLQAQAHEKCDGGTSGGADAEKFAEVWAWFKDR